MITIMAHLYELVKNLTHALASTGEISPPFREVVSAPNFLGTSMKAFHVLFLDFSGSTFCVFGVVWSSRTLEPDEAKSTQPKTTRTTCSAFRRSLGLLPARAAVSPIPKVVVWTSGGSTRADSCSRGASFLNRD